MIYILILILIFMLILILILININNNVINININAGARATPGGSELLSHVGVFAAVGSPAPPWPVRGLGRGVLGWPVVVQWR